MARSSRWRRSASPADPVRRNASEGGAGPAEAADGSGARRGGGGGGEGAGEEEEERRWRVSSSSRDVRRRHGSGRESLGKMLSGKAEGAAAAADCIACGGEGKISGLLRSAALRLGRESRAVGEDESLVGGW